jgi:hypothetical protein
MIAALVMVVVFMVWKPLATAYEARKQAVLKRSIFALPNGAGPEHMRGAPLPIAATAPSEKDFRKLYAAWLDRTVMAHFPSENDPKGAAYMRMALDYLASGSEVPISDELQATERSFRLKDINESGLLLMIGVMESGVKRQGDALDKAVYLMPGSTYPKFIWFLAAANAGRAATLNGANAEDIKARDELSLKYLEEGLADGSFQPGEMAVLRWRFCANSVQDLFFRNGPEVAQIFEQSPNIAQWLKDYVKGVRDVNAAWAARGSDVAQNVSQQGWDGFRQNLALAREHLVSAWNENPHDPAAATEMIKVVMGENEEKEKMRIWFDRAVAADFDYLAAYHQFEWGLRPRWLGSYEEMNAFGEECAATGRYDTQVPYQRVAVALQISEDARDRGQQFTNQRIAGEVLDVLDRYFAEPDPPISIDFSHTAAAIVAWKSGRTDEMKRQMAAVHYMPTTTPLFAQMTDLNRLSREAQAGQ